MAFLSKVYVSKEKCPYCGKTVNFDFDTILSRRKNTVGKPFAHCKTCFGQYIIPYKNEWITMSPDERKNFMRFGGWQLYVLIFASILSISFLCSGIAGGIVGLIIIGAVLLLIGVICPILLQLKKKHAVKKSIERTKVISYIALLQEADYEFYPGSNVDFGHAEFPVSKRILAVDLIDSCIQNKNDRVHLLSAMVDIEELNTKYYSADDIMAVVSKELKSDSDFILYVIRFFPSISLKHIGKELRKNADFMNEVKNLKRMNTKTTTR